MFILLTIPAAWTGLLQPDLILGAPVTALTPEAIARHQLRGLVLDVDETLVPLRSAGASQELREWVAGMRELVALQLVSNNLSETRIGSIARELDLPYTTGARKPSRRKLRQAVADMNLPVEAVAMVGDRLFTDVLAGNRLGTFTILVEPMVDPDAARDYPIRNLEVRLSQWLGVSLSNRHNPTP